MKKLIAILMTVTMITVSVLGSGFSLENPKVYGAEQSKPESMKIPIVIYDHLNDNMLFEYVLGTKLSMFDEATQSGTGLVNEELGEDGTPVYKKETVIQVAKDLKEYLETQNPNEQTELFKRLKTQITKEGSEYKLLGKELSLKERGWDFGNLTYSQVDGNDYWKNGDDVVWKRDGDQLIATVENAKATFDFGKLEAGTYKFVPYENLTDDVELKIVTSDKAELVSQDNKYPAGTGYEFTLDKADNVKLEVRSTSATGKLVNPGLYKDNVLIDKFAKITMPMTEPIADTDWVVPNGSTWKTSTYGGITCDNGETTEIYYTLDVEPGRTFTVTDVFNESDIYNVKVRDYNTDKLIKENLKVNETFTVPAGTTKIKVALSSNKTSDSDNVKRFGLLSIKSNLMATLGSDDDLDKAYENSKAKFTTVSGQKAATSYDIENCMDYAYYVLNTFWTDTNGDITKKTNAYNSLRLDLVNDKYTYNNSNTVYDTTNKVIYRDEKSAPEGEGFFPLDDSVLGDKSDLTAPFGKTDEVSGHNFHYAMKAHCEFTYTEESNLSFNFSGDDDVYLFINNKLCMDIGGAHGRLDGAVDLNDPDVKAKLGLKEGEVYTFDFFYMERHTTASNITITTNMYLEQVSAKTSIKYTDANGNKIADGTKFDIGDEIGIEYGVEAGSNNMQDITFKDTGIGVTIGKDGIDLGDKGAYVKDKLVIEVIDSTGNVKKTYEISAEDLKDENKKRQFIDEISNIKINKKESVVVKGITTKVESDSVTKSYLDVDISAPEKGYDNNGNVVSVISKTPVSPVDIKVIPKADVKAEMKVDFVDATTGNEIPKDSVVDEGVNVGLKYTIVSKSGYMKNLSVSDSLGGNNPLSVSGQGIKLGDSAKVGENGITITRTDKDGNVLESYTLSKSDFEAKNDNYQKFIEKLGDGNNAIVMDKDDQLVITGFETTVGENGIKAEPTGTITGPNPQYNEENGTVTVSYDKANLDATGKLISKSQTDVSYTIKYVDENGNEISKSEVKTGKYGEKVTEPSKNIEGYTPKEKEKSLTLGDNGNEIVFVYEKSAEDNNNNSNSNNNNNSNSNNSNNNNNNNSGKKNKNNSKTDKKKKSSTGKSSKNSSSKKNNGSNSKNTPNTNNNGSVKGTGNSTNNTGTTNSAVSNAPQTGETNGIYGWISIFGITLVLSLSLLFRRKFDYKK